ncbi:MAG: 16S rRNA (adenine(1518)-N(6)/adenine(1519)-N(6))-dimethyltransferase RsmA [Gammaproteobacteria bacterium]
MKGHTARKRFGQHFLHDPHVIEKIINCIPAAVDRVIVEIGPGLGALTEPLLKTCPQLELIEIDRDLIARLRQQLQDYPTLQIHEADVLQFDFSRYAANRAFIIGNLPYNISTPVIFHLLDSIAYIDGMLFMLQKEVVERIGATSGGKDYGRLSVMIQAQCRVEKMFDVKPGAFSPPPGVDSSVVLITPAADTRPAIADPTLFADIVAAAFSQRRKKISNSLAQFIDKAQLEQINIPAHHRAEVVTVDDYIKIANRVYADNTTVANY